MAGPLVGVDPHGTSKGVSARLYGLGRCTDEGTVVVDGDGDQLDAWVATAGARDGDARRVLREGVDDVLLGLVDGAVGAVDVVEVLEMLVPQHGAAHNLLREVEGGRGVEFAGVDIDGAVGP